MPSVSELESALIRTNPRLSKFNPIGRILFFDDFDEGVNGLDRVVRQSRQQSRQYPTPGRRFCAHLN